MADYRRGGYNNRKRRYRDDDNDYRSQRRRHEVPIGVRIRNQLLSLAESPVRSWQEEATQLGRLVAENDDGDDGEHGGNGDGRTREAFVRLATQLAVEQPLKTPFVAATLLATNGLRPAVVQEAIGVAAKQTEAATAKGDWRTVKLLLRLLACLQPVLEGDDGESLFGFLDTLFARAVDLQTASSDDVVGTELVKTILLTIPYVMAGAAEQPSEGLQQRAADLMEKTDVIASEPHVLQKLMDPYWVGGEEDGKEGDGKEGDDDGPVAAESVLALLQKQLQNEASQGWPLACLPRPWKVQQGSRDEEEKKHTLPTMTVPDKVVAGERPLYPEMYFSVYGAADTKKTVWSVPPTSSVASLLIRDSLLDTINGMDFNRNATARFLIDVDCYFAEGTFVKRATPFDRLGEVAESGPERKSTWKPEDVVVDTVFSQLFQLPTPEHKLVYYHALLAETCKIAPAAIAPSLGRAIRYLYRHCDRMDLELVTRLVDWFAHHLSNFGFTWKWTEWADDVARPDTEPHKAFIRGAIDKEIRLSFAQRIKNTLPEAYQGLITEAMEQDVPPFKYDKDGDDVPYAAEGRDLVGLLKRKAPEEEIQAVIERIHSQALDGGSVQPLVQPLVASTDVFMTAVLYVGSKSLSHVLACIERVQDRLLDAGAASPAARRQILAAVMAFWAPHHPGVALCIVEKLLNYAILAPDVVVDWALDPVDKDRHLAETHVVELVLSTVRKVVRRAKQVEAAEAEEAKAEEAKAAEAKAEAADVDVEAENETKTDTEAEAKTQLRKLLQQMDSLLVEEDEQGWTKRFRRVVARQTAVSL